MKMGTIASPWRYDAAAQHALQPARLRRPAILHCASRALFPPDFAGLSGHPSIAAVSIYAPIDVMGHRQTSQPGHHDMHLALADVLCRPLSIHSHIMAVSDRHSVLRPIALTSNASAAICFSTYTSSSLGVITIGSTPSSASLSRTRGSCSASSVSR